MIIDSKVYSGDCVCGKSHDMVTKAAIIQAGCLADFEKYMDNFAVSGKRCALYDANTYDAVGKLRPRAEQEIVLSPAGLHADERGVELVMEQLEQGVEVIIALGSGTIHDLARFCANEIDARFISVPTAASVDGFCSTVAAMTWHGYKKTVPSVAPEIVIADIDIISRAPINMARSGVGDILAKYTALADWKISNILTDEYLCPVIYDIMQEAADRVRRDCRGILQGDAEAYESLTYALVMSGIAMQMMGNSRPASGAEHHISHLLEMKPAAMPVRFEAMHGEKTGIGTVLASGEYHRLTQVEDIKPYIRSSWAGDTERLSKFFGHPLWESIQKENENDCMSKVTPERLSDSWDEIRQIVSQIPSSAELYKLLEDIGAKRTPEDMGISADRVEELFDYSPFVRNRLTLMRVRRIINL